MVHFIFFNDYILVKKIILPEPSPRIPSELNQSSNQTLQQHNQPAEKKDDKKNAAALQSKKGGKKEATPEPTVSLFFFQIFKIETTGDLFGTRFLRLYKLA